jgi:transposase, IS30 family
MLSPEKWSPDTAIGYAKANGMFKELVSTKTFYNWIDDGLTNVKNIDLLLKVRRKPNSPRKDRKKILGKSIDERPKEVEAREEFGHWEGDGIVGKGNKGHIITLVERKLGIGLMWNVLDRKEDKILTELDKLKGQSGYHFNDIFKSITFDNGSEFSASDEMEKHNGLKIYYAHPYSAWERPINENWNGLVRRFIPKGKSFDDLTDHDIERVMHYINTLPRKRLGYKTPLELWNEELKAIMSA